MNPEVYNLGFSVGVEAISQPEQSGSSAFRALFTAKGITWAAPYVLVPAVAGALIGSKYPLRNAAIGGALGASAITLLLYVGRPI